MKSTIKTDHIVAEENIPDENANFRKTNATQVAGGQGRMIMRKGEKRKNISIRP